MEPEESRATYDQSSDAVERKSAREEAPVWGMLPLFAIIGAIVAMLAAFGPAQRGALFFLLLTVAAFLAAGAILLWNRQRRHR